MHKNPSNRGRYTQYPLGLLRSLIVISDWVSYIGEGNQVHKTWSYKNQKAESIQNASVIFVPVDYTRVFQEEKAYLLLYGVGIYWTKFSITHPQTITIDHRFLNGLLLPEEKWLDSHFNTEPFVFPPGNDFILSDYLLEFPFTSLSKQEDPAGQRKRAFGRGIILAQLVFPFKEPLLMLKKATEGYNEFDSPNSPLRVLISEYDSKRRINQISIEMENSEYEQTLPGIESINSDLLNFFPEKWRNEVYLQGLRREISKIAKDFAFIGAPLILN
ncbi:MAG: hypothetical protein ACXAB2_03720 [Candidatus Hodarchaeales archaeon]|jgi:hypothetical protein